MLRMVEIDIATRAVTNLTIWLPPGAGMDPATGRSPPGSRRHMLRGKIEQAQDKAALIEAPRVPARTLQT